jgi:uncharacterized protein
MSQSVIDDTAGKQLVLQVDGTIATLEYKLHGDRLHLVHTEVPEAFRGQGVGGLLVEAALAKSRAEHLTIVPWCSYARTWLMEHPDQSSDASVDFTAVHRAEARARSTTPPVPDHRPER